MKPSVFFSHKKKCISIKIMILCNTWGLGALTTIPIRLNMHIYEPNSYSKKQRKVSFHTPSDLCLSKEWTRICMLLVLTLLSNASTKIVMHLCMAMSKYKGGKVKHLSFS